MRFTYLKNSDFVYIPFGDPLHSYSKKVNESVKFQYEKETNIFSGIYLYKVSTFNKENLSVLVSDEKRKYVDKVLEKLWKEDER